jgi:membrane protein implicated in regulation of membrane protease activity
MVSLIMGLLALVCNILALLPNLIPNLSTGFLSFIGFVFAIVAVATGNNILKTDSRDKNARAGKTIGTICIVLAVIAIVLFFALPFGLVACTACAGINLLT